MIFIFAKVLRLGTDSPDTLEESSSLFVKGPCSSVASVATVGLPSDRFNPSPRLWRGPCLSLYTIFIFSNSIRLSTNLSAHWVNPPPFSVKSLPRFRNTRRCHEYDKLRDFMMSIQDRFETVERIFA